MPFSPDVSTLVDAIARLGAAEKVAFSESIFSDVFEAGEISRYHNIMTDVRNGDPIPIMDRGEDWEYMKDASGLSSLCDDLPCSIDTPVSVKTWAPAPYKCTDEFCSKDLNLQMLDYFNSVRLLDNFDENTFYIDFIKFLIERRIKASHWTKTYFAATGATSTALTGHNGLFAQMAVAAPDGDANRVDIAKNDGASYAAQRLTPTEGFTIVNAMYEAVDANRKLQSRDDVVIQVTRTIASAYLAWLRENKQQACCERDPLTGIYTYEGLAIYGRKIAVINEWDRIIDSIADFNDATAHVNPHRAIATYKNNVPIGTGDAQKLSSFDLKYDDYTEKAKFKAEYTFDTKVLQDDAFVLAM